MKRPRTTVSLVMIVKNEEDHLERCLSSAKDFVDEILILDTGSTDRTKEIAASFGARVIDHEWKDNFAEARNAALAAATTDWVLQMDADEELGPGKESLRQLVGDKFHRFYYVRIATAAGIDSLDETIDSFIAIRLFRRSDGLRYHNIIHEELKPVDESRLTHSDLTIVHFGPLTREGASNSKRNIPLLERAIKDDPENGIFYYYLGNEYFGLRDYERAGSAYHASLDRTSPDVVYAHELLRNYAWCLYRIGREAEAMSMLRDLQSGYPDYTDLYFMEGEIAMDRREYERAVELFQRCLAMGDPPSYYFSLGGTGSWRARGFLSKAMSVLSRQATNAAKVSDE